MAAAFGVVPVYAASSDVEVNVCYPPSVPTLASPSEDLETEDSSVMMSGSATAGSLVYAVRNDTEVGFVTAAPDGSYSISVSLVVGENVIKAREKNVCLQSADSVEEVTVNRLYVPPPEPPVDPKAPSSPQKPAIDLGLPDYVVPPIAPPVQQRPDPDAAIRPIITEPEDGATVSEVSILVRGEAGAHTVVRLYLNNDLVASVLSDEYGQFAVSVGLRPGENRLVATVGSKQGDLSSKAVAVHYQPADAEPGRRMFWLPIMIGYVLSAWLAALLIFLARYTIARRGN